jgi:hypothetical protein
MSATDAAGTSYGERLLRSAGVQRAAEQVLEEVRQHLADALHGPLAGAIAAHAGVDPTAGGQPGRDPNAPDEAQTVAEATELLASALPRRFIAVGAALSTAYAALGAGDEVRTAGALLCAQRLLLPDDPAGVAAIAQATDAALERAGIASSGGTSGASATTAAGAPTAGQVEEMQRQVLAGAELLERARAASATQITEAVLRARSILAVTRGAVPGSAAEGAFGPFVPSLVRWAFFIAAALLGLRADDWSRVGAALVAALRNLQHPGTV